MYSVYSVLEIISMVYLLVLKIKKIHSTLHSFRAMMDVEICQIFVYIVLLYIVVIIFINSTNLVCVESHDFIVNFHINTRIVNKSRFIRRLFSRMIVQTKSSKITK